MIKIIKKEKLKVTNIAKNIRGYLLCTWLLDLPSNTSKTFTEEPVANYHISPDHGNVMY